MYQTRTHADVTARHSAANNSPSGGIAIPAVYPTLVEDHSRTLSPASGQGVVQLMKVEDARDLAKQMNLIDLYEDFIAFTMVEMQVMSEEEVLTEESVGTLRESLTAWSQPANRKKLKEYAAYGHGMKLSKDKQLIPLKHILEMEDTLKERGREGNLQNFLKVGGIKGLKKEELLQHEKTYSEDVLVRKYPFPFPNQDSFNYFAKGLAGVIRNAGINAMDIRIQGSSLRKPDPKDIDIGIMVTKEEYERIIGIVGPKVENRGNVTKTFKQYTGARNLGIYFLGMISDTTVKEDLKGLFRTAGCDAEKTDVQATVIEAGSRLDSSLYMSLAEFMG